jgi:hypothetical protein
MWEMVVALNWSAMATCPAKWLSGSATKTSAVEMTTRMRKEAHSKRMNWAALAAICVAVAW